MSMTKVKVKVNVTQEIIDRSIPRRAHECPLFHAFEPLVQSEYAHPKVGVFPIGETYYVSIYEYNTLNSPRYPLPAEVSKRIRNYDNGKGMEPFSFEMELPTDKLKPL